MKKILAIVSRDVRSGTRDWLIVYLSVVPFFLALLLRLVVPGVMGMSLNVVALEADPLVATISRYAQVETVASQELLEERVMRLDDVLGVRTTGEKTEIILQGNELPGSEQMLTNLLNRLHYRDAALPAVVEFSDLGWEMSPLKLQGATMLMLFITVFGGMFIVLNFVDEKMHRTLAALNVAPLSRLQMVVGKALLGFVLPVVGTIGAALILGFPGIDLGMFFVSVLSLAFISVIIGFAIGVVHNEPIAAVASMKVVFLPVFASVFGAMFLAREWQWVLYWSPYYWAYDNLNAILLAQATWAQVLANSGVILAITALVFLALRKRIVEGFN